MSNVIAPVRGESRARSFGAALERLNSAQKPGVGVPAYTRWVNRRLARYAAAAAFRLGLSANTVSVVSFLLSASGLAVLLALDEQRLLAGVVAAVLLALGYVLDSADGQLARLSGTAAPAGEWLDHVLDSVRSPAIHLAVAVGVILSGAFESWLAPVALVYALAVSGSFMSQMLAGMMLDKRGAARVAPHPRQSWLLLPTDTGVVCWLFVLWGLPGAFAVAYTLLFLFNVAHMALSTRRRFNELNRLSQLAAR